MSELPNVRARRWAAVMILDNKAQVIRGRTLRQATAICNAWLTDIDATKYGYVSASVMVEFTCIERIAKRSRNK